MEGGTAGDWSGSPLFSPSKARAQQAQAKDWAFVDTWLSKRYASKRLLAFERNDETLQALLALASLNDSADEQRTCTERVEKAALQSLSKRVVQSNNELQQLLSDGLGSHGGLDALSRTMVCLECSNADSAEAATAIINLTSSKFEIEQQVQRVEYQLSALKSEQRKATELLSMLEQDELQTPQDLPEHTTEWVRSAKLLKAKVAEYDERLSMLRPSKPANSLLNEIEEQQAHQLRESQRMDELYVELRAFQSLPSDSKAARAKLEAAKEELYSAMHQRDGLFERLVRDK